MREFVLYFDAQIFFPISVNYNNLFGILIFKKFNAFFTFDALLLKILIYISFKMIIRIFMFLLKIFITKFYHFDFLEHFFRYLASKTITFIYLINYCINQL